MLLLTLTIPAISKPLRMESPKGRDGQPLGPSGAHERAHGLGSPGLARIAVPSPVFPRPPTDYTCRPVTAPTYGHSPSDYTTRPHHHYLCGHHLPNDPPTAYTSRGT